MTIVLSVFVEADEGEGRPERSSVPAQGTGAAPRCQVKLALLFESRAGIALAQGLGDPTLDPAGCLELQRYPPPPLSQKLQGRALRLPVVEKRARVVPRRLWSD